MKYILTGILINLLMNGVAHASHHHDSESNKPSGDGHCAYMADNPFAGDPYKACRTNVSESFCKAFLKLEMASCLFSIHNMALETAQGNHQSARAKEVDGKKFITKIAIKVQWA